MLSLVQKEVVQNPEARNKSNRITYPGSLFSLGFLEYSHSFKMKAFTPGVGRQKENTGYS